MDGYLFRDFQGEIIELNVECGSIDCKVRRKFNALNLDNERHIARRENLK